MARRVVPIAVALLVLLALPASGGGGTAGRKSAIDARLHRVQAKIAWADRRRRELAAQIAEVNSRIQSLSREVGDVSARLVTIERDLALHQEKLDKLNALFKVETERYFSFRHQYDITVERLDSRLVDIYENGEPTDLDVLLSAKSFSSERRTPRADSAPARARNPRHSGPFGRCQLNKIPSPGAAVCARCKRAKLHSALNTVNETSCEMRPATRAARGHRSGVVGTRQRRSVRARRARAARRIFTRWA